MNLDASEWTPYLLVEMQSAKNLIKLNTMFRPVPPQDNLLALCAANRSAVSFHVGNFGDAILDINYALAHGYPEGSKFKVSLGRDRFMSHLRLILVTCVHW